MVYFFIRFIAASDKLWFMLELYSFVDYFTIPPSFISIYLGRTWIARKFRRSPEFQQPHPLTYWECVYFLIVTMSTVGYGDIYCETSLGRGFIVLFILVGLAVFASCIPEIIDLVGTRPKYSGEYRQEHGKRYSTTHPPAFPQSTSHASFFPFLAQYKAFHLYADVKAFLV
ncbi:calcium-activated potassium channel slowpoke [Caerostris extrusa]|uniref:Calcium-activated potassium channel slowpoke n=1 Tax=Caerostris extrusa TaxID=172846 RepID=A0AAV4N519_CAEEX|nr:calcium-activated potassium channel slowpoke [Caerostris extrusa]